MKTSWKHNIPGRVVCTRAFKAMMALMRRLGERVDRWLAK